MKHGTRRVLAFLFVIFCLVLLPAVGSACPACYGAANSSRIDGMNTAIMAMLGITGMVLTGISTFFFIIMRRRVRFNQIGQLNAPGETSLPGTSYVNEKGNIEWNNS